MRKGLLGVIVSTVLIFVALHEARAQQPGRSYRVDALAVAGNRRLDTEAILNSVELRPGTLTTDQISETIKKLYRTGFFEQVTAGVVTSDKRQVLRFVVTEKPIVRKVYIKGNEDISEGDLSEVLTFGERRFIDKTAIEHATRRAQLFYQSRGYYEAEFEHSVVAVGDNQVDITFTVKEGPRYKIRKVQIKGLKEVDEDEIVDLLQTRRYKWWNSWLFGTGRVNEEFLKADKGIIQQALLDQGYVDSSVSEGLVEKIEDGLRVTFEVNEGPQYNYGTITVSGDLIEGSAEQTLEGIKSRPGDTFSATELRSDAFTISDKFADRGYAYVNVTPNTNIDRSARAIIIDFNVDQGSLVTINKINIKGNHKTYDNVIRRTLKVNEQELYSGSKVKRSQALLQRLGYFEEATITTQNLPEKDKVDLDVNVREASTGTFSAGMGYSTSDGALFNARLSENNIYGTGRNASLNVDIGTRRDNIVLSVSDPRVNDSYWSLGGNLLRTDREFNDFDRQLQGGGIDLGYPLEEAFSGKLFEDIKFSTRYEALGIDISNIEADAAQLVIDSEGSSTVSGITPALTRNTIDNPLNPTEGGVQSLSIELTGLGGDHEYYLLDARNTWYEPLIKTESFDLVFSWRTHVSYGETYNDDTFPLFRRFFPGGINSVRGYKNRTLGPVDERGNEFGGSKQFINNFELIFPLVNAAGLKGVVFYDAGQAFDDDQSIKIDDLRLAYGTGIRWSSPLGPIRVEFGFPIDRQEGESSMVTQFSFGAPF